MSKNFGGRNLFWDESKQTKANIKKNKPCYVMQLKCIKTHSKLSKFKRAWAWHSSAPACINNQKVEHNEIMHMFTVKLHSELANPTELQLDGVGVDFVCHKNKPHLASTRRNIPSRISYMFKIWWHSCGCLEVVRGVSGGCHKDVWRVFMGCPNGVWDV